MTSAFLLTTWSMKPGSWWLKPLWSCRQTSAREHVVERRDRPPPGHVPGDLEPLRVLVEHRVDDVDERLVAVEDAVAAGEQVALEPALALVLREHLHDPPVRREVVVAVDDLGHPRPVGDLEDGAEPVGRGLVRPEHPEVVGVRGHDVAEVRAEDACGLRGAATRRGDVDRVVAEVGQLEVAQELAAVRDGVRAHPPRAGGRQGRELREEAPLVVEQLVGPVGAHPALEDRAVLRVRADLAHRDLVRAPGALDLVPVDLLRPGPALRRPEHDHRPAAAAR